MAGVSEYDNEPSSPIKGGEFLSKISDNMFYKKDSVPRSRSGRN
jgi:hypothetical protein